MNGDALQRFAPGQGLGTLRADTMNALVDAAKIVRAKMSKGQTGGRFQPLRQGPGSLEVLIRNDTGATLSERSVVQIGHPIQIPVTYKLDIQERPSFAGVEPTSANGTPAVLIDPTPDGGVGRAVIMGVAMVSVDITNAAHTRAALEAGETGQLLSGTSGPATILWREEGIGVKLCAVLLCCGTGTPAVGDADDWVYPPDGAPATLVACNGRDISLPLARLEFSDKSGVSTVLPDSVSLTRVPAVDSASGFHSGNPPGWIIQGASQTAGVYFGKYEYDTYDDCAHLWLTCGGSGIVLHYIGYVGPSSLIGPLNGGPLSTAEQPYTLFDSPGSLELGTITGVFPTRSAKVTLVWE